MADSTGVIVIGDGAIGGFVVSALLGRGLPGDRVTWLGHRASWLTRSSTRFSGGLIRCAVRPGVTADLAIESYLDTWAGHPDFVRTGSATLMDPRNGDSTRAVAQQMAAKGVDVVCRPIAELIPAWRTTDDRWALFEPNGGHASPVAVRGRLVRTAARRGVQLEDRSPVTGIVDGHARVVVRTAARSYVAGAVVVAAGAATAALVPSGVVPRRLREIGYGYFDDLLPRGLPALDDAERGTWWRPAPTRRHPGRHLIGRAVSTTSDGRSLAVRSITQERDIRSAVETTLPAAAGGRYLSGVRSFDVAAATGPGLPWTASLSGRVIAVSGLDGGGFKLAPAIGSRVANSVHEEEARP